MEFHSSDKELMGGWGFLSREGPFFCREVCKVLTCRAREGHGGFSSLNRGRRLFHRKVLTCGELSFLERWEGCTIGRC